ncbi:hypothetical protein BKA70DRAFT_1431996 [Coprinopsis sp. MPI-PUGE-AT-0042]|nr:hypothetical protein BKA70DRAFT_1431996 [Coprinopsis sp. MPI-PUGE-AT-0042]
MSSTRSGANYNSDTNSTPPAAVPTFVLPPPGAPPPYGAPTAAVPTGLANLTANSNPSGNRRSPHSRGQGRGRNPRDAPGSPAPTGHAVNNPSLGGSPSNNRIRAPPIPTMPPPAAASSSAVTLAPGLGNAPLMVAGTGNDFMATVERMITLVNRAAEEQRVFFAEQQAQTRDFFNRVLEGLNTHGRDLPPHLNHAGQIAAPHQNNPPATAPAAIPIVVNIANPSEDNIPKFYGRSPQDTMEHIASCENVFRGRNTATKFASDEAKIRFSLKACAGTGPAATWRTNGQHRLNHGNWMALSWEGYVSEFRQCFGWVKPHQAVAQLIATFRKPDESAAHFLLTVDNQVIHSEWDATQDVALIAILRMKMNPEIVKKIPASVTAYQDFQRLAVEADEKLCDHQMAKTSYLEATRGAAVPACNFNRPAQPTPPSGSTLSSTLSSSAHTSTTPSPMATPTSTPASGSTSTGSSTSDPNKPRRLLCYTCRKEGHTSRNCLEKGKAKAHTASMVEEAEEHSDEQEFEIEEEEEGESNGQQDF